MASNISMRALDARRYGIVARWREQLEFSMKSVQRISWFSMWMAWVASQLFNTYRGISLVIIGRLEAAQLAIVAASGDTLHPPAPRLVSSSGVLANVRSVAAALLFQGRQPAL